MAKVRSDQTQPLRSAQRLLDALSSFTVEKPARTLTEISDELELAPSTVRRLLLALEGHGLLTLDRDSGRYRVARQAERLGDVARIGRLIGFAQPALQRLRDETTETVILGTLDGAESVHVDVHKGTQLISAYNPPGTRFPAWAGYAIAQTLIAWLPEATIRRIAPPADRWTVVHPHAPASIDELLADLQRVRRRGYSVNDRRTEPDVWAIAAPIWSPDRQVEAAVSIVAPAPRIKRPRQTELIAALTAATDALSHAWPSADER